MKQTSVALVALLAACSSPPRATELSATAAPLKAKTPEAAARAYLDEKAREYGLTPSTLRLVHVHDTGRGGLIAVFRAQQQGVDLVERDVKVLLKRDLTPIDAIAAAATTLGNVGPGLGVAGPIGSFRGFSDVSTATMTILMWLGRLEVIPVLVLATRRYWRV